MKKKRTRTYSVLSMQDNIIEKRKKVTGKHHYHIRLQKITLFQLIVGDIIVMVVYQ